MRILWSSNSPFCKTGYGQQTAYLTTYLTSAGHDVAIFAFYGHEGSVMDWGHIPIFPNPEDDYGAKHTYDCYKQWKADILISLIDVWVERSLEKEMRWYPWTPIDHEPMPPDVKETLKNHLGLVKPIAMSRFGLEEMRKQGIDAYYAPHGVDCEAFQPDLKARQAARQTYGWEDKFVIGSVGTNVRERKNWTAIFLALQKFARYHDDVLMYCHTDAFETRGRNLQLLRESLGVQNITFFTPGVEMLCGIETSAMAAMYNALDVYLQPSKGEGFGIPIIEAQACGVPVIVTNCTAMPELVGGGWLLKDLRPEWTQQSSWEAAANPDEIVEHLEAAYKMKKSGELAELKVQARAKAIEYDEAVVFKQFWLPILADIEESLTKPRYGEGYLNPGDWRKFLIPQTAEPGRVIDIGCGLKQQWKPYLEGLGEYTGVDIRGSGNGVIEMDAHDLKFPKGHFGFAWCAEVLEHVEHPKRVVREAQRVARHGCIVFCTPQAGDFPNDPDHKVVSDVKYTVSQDGHGLIQW